MPLGFDNFMYPVGYLHPSMYTPILDKEEERIDFVAEIGIRTDYVGASNVGEKNRVCIELGASTLVTIDRDGNAGAARLGTRDRGHGAFAKPL